MGVSRIDPGFNKHLFLGLFEQPEVKCRNSTAMADDETNLLRLSGGLLVARSDAKRSRVRLLAAARANRSVRIVGEPSRPSQATNVAEPSQKAAK